MSIKRINVPGLTQLPSFCHAVQAGDFIYLSGCLGTLPNDEIAKGGIAAQTRQTLENIKQILKGCGTSLNDLVKVNVFLADMNDFSEMNSTYIEIFGSEVPARITVGKVDLALSALVEIDCIAYQPNAD